MTRLDGLAGRTRVSRTEVRPPRVLTVAPFVPHPELPHAGGQYLWAHISNLSRSHSCELIAPDTPENRAAAPAGAEIFDLQLTSPAVRISRQPHLDRMAQLVTTLFWPVFPERRQAKALALEIQQRLATVDVVELQWPEYAGLLPAIRRAAPELPIVVVEHDVLSQRLARDIAVGPTWRTRLRARLTTRRARRLERTYLNQADRVLVFSEKDAELLRDGGVSTPVEVLLPPLEDPRMWTADVSPRGVAARILLVAAFDREVNDAAARWFITEVFPHVRHAVPNAVLVLAGARMRDGLRHLAESTPGVELTGFVRDLAEPYGAAEVAVAPLLAGAGLKFKVATAMMWGLPVVATTVGAEGYPVGRDLFVGVADDPADFAQLVVAALTEREQARATARRGQDWALATFSEETFRSRLEATYAAVAAAGHPGGAR